MTNPTTAAANAVTQQAECIQAMRDEGERRVAAMRERRLLGEAQAIVRHHHLMVALGYAEPHEMNTAFLDLVLRPVIAR
jgi:hypothetical protein